MHSFLYLGAADLCAVAIVFLRLFALIVFTARVFSPEVVAKFGSSFTMSTFYAIADKRLLGCGVDFNHGSWTGVSSPWGKISVGRT